MKEIFIKLHNALSLIEVKGQNAKLMADCLAFIENTVAEIETEENTKNENEPA